jgi:hypothetical protein
MTQFTVAISSCHGWTGGLTGRTIRPPLHSALRQERRPDTGAKTSVETREFQPWVLKDFRKTCATFYDEHIPESSVEILGHSAGEITYRHYAYRVPLAFKAIMTIPQPSAFSALTKGFDGQCPCCRRRFTDAVSASAARSFNGWGCRNAPARHRSGPIRHPSGRSMPVESDRLPENVKVLRNQRLHRPTIGA